MILQVYENEKDRILNLLKDDPSRALFIVGDILNYGMHRDFQDVWVDEDNEGIHGIYLRYRSNLVFYIFDKVVDNKGVERLINDDRITIISSTRSHMDKLPQQCLVNINARETYFCECKELKEERSNAIKATINDIPEIIDGLMSITEFNLDKRPKEERIEDMKLDFDENDKVVYILKDEGKLVSAASSSAQSNHGVMVVGVFTLEAYRQKGYARQVVYALSKWAHDKGLVPCLFYDNPSAGKLYHDLGYVTFDTWVMGVKKV